MINTHGAKFEEVVESRGERSRSLDSRFPPVTTCGSRPVMRRRNRTDLTGSIWRK
jgi:hypothetical protein